MKNDDITNREWSNLRKRAVEILHKNPSALATLPSDDVEKLANELSVYQIELEMQNEELRKTQEELIRSREEYSELYDFAPVGYLTLSNKGIIWKLNLTAASMLGKERVYLNKKLFSNFILPEDMRKYYLYRQKILDTQATQECEFRIKQADENLFWAHMRCCPVTDENRNVIEIRSILTDITKRKWAEEGREQCMKIIRSQNEELKSIVEVTSHDLNNPLVNIVGFSNIISGTCAELRQILNDTDMEPSLKQKMMKLFDENISEDLDFISASTDKMRNLLNGLMKVSRIGKMTFNIEQLDMNEMLTNIVKNFRLKINACGGSIKVDNLPDCLGNIDMINQVFSNLIDNAIKYQNPERKLKIHIWGRTENRMSVYCVKDNGVGIDPANHESVFEIFHRLNPNDGIGGEGLGLNIVIRVLNKLNGRVSVESEVGKGSRFIISLPTAKLQAYS